MEVVYWNKPDKTALLYNGGMFFNGYGEQVFVMKGLPKPVGPSRMGWYHCIPADIYGDERENIIDE